MHCPHCKTENSPGSLLCSKCGRSLTSDLSGASAFDAPVAASSTASPVVSLNKPLTSGEVAAEGTTYQPSGRSAPGAVPKLLLAGLISGLVVGAVYAGITQFFSLLILFPLIAGFLVGLGVQRGVKSGKIRNPKMVGVVGALAGLLMMGAADFTSAMINRGDMIAGFAASENEDLGTKTQDAKGATVEMTPTQLAAREQTLRDDYSKGFTPLRTLVIYEMIDAAAGTSIGRPGSGGGIPIQGKLYYLLRAFEILLVMGVASAVASGAASEPFCENCDKWEDDKEVLKVHPSQNAELWDKINARDWNGLMETVPATGIDEKNVTKVKITHCTDCGNGTISATSAGGTVPAEVNNIVLAPASTRALLEKSQESGRMGTG